MDPVIVLHQALNGNKDAAHAYNSWVNNGGFMVEAKAWTHLAPVPQEVTVLRVWTKVAKVKIGYTITYLANSKFFELAT